MVQNFSQALRPASVLRQRCTFASIAIHELHSSKEKLVFAVLPHRRIIWVNVENYLNSFLELS
jgi:hypothetical protein